MAQLSEPTRPTSPDRLTIVAAVDRSDYASIVVDHAIAQASRTGKAELHVVTVDPATAAAGDEGARSARADLERLRALVTERVELMGTEGLPPGWRIGLHVRSGDAADEIAALAGDVGADLVVVGHFGMTGGGGWLADQVMNQVTCPTLVVRMGDQEITGGALTCPACVAVRHDSGGERWFCEEHSAQGDDRPDRASVLLPHGDLGQGGIGMW